MVKRICVMFPDGSLQVFSGQNSEAANVAEARRTVKHLNRGERDKNELAQFGQIEVDLMSFRERF